MNELTEQEELQVEMSAVFVDKVIMPAIDVFEDALSLIAKDGDFIGCPHFDTMVGCVRELVERGWLTEELIEQVRHHADDQASERGKRVVN